MSNLPCRHELLGGLGLDFEVKVLPDIDKPYPDSLPAAKVASYISREKAAPYRTLIGGGSLVITADTTVIVGDEVFGKPKGAKDVCRMLQLISGRTHQIITSACLLTIDKEHTFSMATNVTFKQLLEDEIAYYIEHYKPFDKMRACGIQEWTGYVGVISTNGSYFNVMGLPVQRLWEEIKKL